MFASFRVGVIPIGYNTNLVKKEDAPKSFADLLDPKWTGKIVKAHPGYSGTIMTVDLRRWRAISAGTTSRSSPSRTSCRCSRRPIRRRSSRSASAPCMADGNEYNLLQIKEKKRPGRDRLSRPKARRFIVGPNGIFKARRTRTPARLFQCYCFTAECQQLIVDVGELRSMHPQVKEKPMDASRFARDQEHEGGRRRASRR